MHPKAYANNDFSNVHWTIYARQGDYLIFMSNADEIAKIPLNILDIIINMKNFDGVIEDFDEDVLYMKFGKTMARIPKTLARELTQE